MTKVTLVCCPFLSLQRPALGVSLLKAGLERKGITCDIRYINLEYADFEDTAFCQKMAEGVRTHFLLGEWIFSHLIQGFANERPVDEGMDWVSSRAPEPLVKRMAAAKARASQFVDQQAQAILAGAPDIVGFSSSFQQNCASLSIAARVKELSPDTVICFGGANLEGPMGQTTLKHFTQIDVVFSGEADNTFPDFVTSFAANGNVLDSDTEHFIEGNPISEMDALPVPDYSDYFGTLTVKSYRDRVLPALTFESSRGCWWGAKHHCTFCGLNGRGMGFRSKSADRVSSEIGFLRKTWQVTRFTATDNIMDMGHLRTVFHQENDALDECHFFYEIKANLSTDQLRQLGEAGVTWVQPGIESMDDDILKRMNKGVRALQNVLLLRSAKELGLRVAWNILSGFPGEQPEQYDEMAVLLERLQHFEPPAGVAQLRVDRFSPYHKDPIGLGFGPLRPARAYGHIYRLPDDELMNLAYFFEADRADGLKPAEYIAPVADVVTRWITKVNTVSDANPPARLSFVSIGPMLMVEDTRDIAKKKSHTLSSAERRVLEAFAQPSNRDATLAKLQDDWRDDLPASAVYQQLYDLGYLVEHAQNALHVITTPGQRVVRPQNVHDFPGGYVLPDIAAPQEAAV